MDVLTPEQRHRCMKANKSRGTKPELALGKLLWSCGIRYRKQPKGVAGTPDFCIKKYKLAIFVDGEFWHGRDWDNRKERLKSNRDFWIKKIERNIRRDRAVNARLIQQGWKVFRFWETDIKKHPGVCVSQVLRYLSNFTSISAPQYIPEDFKESYDLLAETTVMEYEETRIAAEPAAEYGKHKPTD